MRQTLKIIDKINHNPPPIFSPRELYSYLKPLSFQKPLSFLQTQSLPAEAGESTSHLCTMKHRWIPVFTGMTVLVFLFTSESFATTCPDGRVLRQRLTCNLNYQPSEEKTCKCPAGWMGTGCITPICNSPFVYKSQGYKRGCCGCPSGKEKVGNQCLTPCTSPRIRSGTSCVCPEENQHWNGTTCVTEQQGGEEVSQCTWSKVSNDICQSGCTVKQSRCLSSCGLPAKSYCNPPDEPEAPPGWTYEQYDPCRPCGEGASCPSNKRRYNSEDEIDPNAPCGCPSWAEFLPPTACHAHSPHPESFCRCPDDQVRSGNGCIARCKGEAQFRVSDCSCYCTGANTHYNGSRCVTCTSPKTRWDSTTKTCGCPSLPSHAYRVSSSTCSWSCSSGYTQSGSRCVRNQVVQVTQCPPSGKAHLTQKSGDRCICPSGQHEIGGNRCCVQATCPTGQTRDAGSCTCSPAACTGGLILCGGVCIQGKDCPGVTENVCHNEECPAPRDPQGLPLATPATCENEEK